MGPAFFQNLLLLIVLGFVLFGLSVLKQRLLQLSTVLSQKAQRRKCLTNPSRDFC